MAKLAPSLTLLFRELDAHWPRRDHRTDGWKRNCRWPNNSSDHCPDAAGIVHAIDVDKDGIDPDWFVSRIIHDHLPTAYVIWNRHIWSRKYDWRKRKYTGTKNPHTDHVHVSIQHTAAARAFNKGWGVASGSGGIGPAPSEPADTAAPWNYAGIIYQSALDHGQHAKGIEIYTRRIRDLRG